MPKRPRKKSLDFSTLKVLKRRAAKHTGPLMRLYEVLNENVRVRRRRFGK